MSVIETLDNVPDGYRVTIHSDDDPANPRENNDAPVHVLTVPDRDYVDVDADPGPWGECWRRLLGAGRYWSEAIEIMERYARIYGGFTYEHCPHRGARSLWYITATDAAEFGDPDAALKAYAAEYEAWAEGHVYGYVIEQAVNWNRRDDPEQTMVTWEQVGSCWGFYGPGTEDVESAARAELDALVSDRS